MKDLKYVEWLTSYFGIIMDELQIWDWKTNKEIKKE